MFTDDEAELILTLLSKAHRELRDKYQNSPIIPEHDVKLLAKYVELRIRLKHYTFAKHYKP